MYGEGPYPPPGWAMAQASRSSYAPSFSKMTFPPPPSSAAHELCSQIQSGAADIPGDPTNLTVPAMLHAFRQAFRPAAAATPTTAIKL